MCGHVGVAGNIFARHIDVFNDLLVINSLRGSHSTGVASVLGRNDEVSIIKKPFLPHDLQSLRKYDNVVTTAAKVLIGHGRHATVGAINSDNAHPFEFAGVVGAHNGTIPAIPRKVLDPHSLFGTDSEALYWNISKDGIEATIPKINGAWALVFYDKVKNTLNFIRNKERPLFFCKEKNSTAIFWASELWMLQGVLNRRNVDLEVDEDGNTFFSPQVDVLYSWDLTGNIRNIPDFTAVKIEGKEEVKAPFVHTTRTGAGSPTSGLETTLSRGPTNTGSNIVPFSGGHGKSTKVPSKDKLARFRPPYDGPTLTSRPFSKETFEEWTQDGCFTCGATVEWGDPAFFINPALMGGEKSFICGDCVLSPEKRELCAITDYQLRRICH